MQEGLATLRGLLEGTELTEKMVNAWLEEKGALPLARLPIGEVVTATHVLSRLGSIRKTMLWVAAHPQKFTPAPDLTEHDPVRDDIHQRIIAALDEKIARERAQAAAPPSAWDKFLARPNWTLDRFLGHPDELDPEDDDDLADGENPTEIEEDEALTETIEDQLSHDDLRPSVDALGDHVRPATPESRALPRRPRHPFAHVLNPAPPESWTVPKPATVADAHSALSIPSVPIINAIPVCPTLWGTARELMAAHTQPAANPFTPAPSPVSTSSIPSTSSTPPDPLDQPDPMDQPDPSYPSYPSYKSYSSCPTDPPSSPKPPPPT